MHAVLSSTASRYVVPHAMNCSTIPHVQLQLTMKGDKFRVELVSRLADGLVKAAASVSQALTVSTNFLKAQVGRQHSWATMKRPAGQGEACCK